MIYYWNIDNDTIGVFGDDIKSPPPGWREATQEEIDAYLLEKARAEKSAELKQKRGAFYRQGFSYVGKKFNFDGAAMENFTAKSGVDPASLIKYKFCDMDGAAHDFEDEPTLAAFFMAARTEHDRVMFKYNDNYKRQIAAASSLAELNAIIIDFSI